MDKVTGLCGKVIAVIFLVMLTITANAATVWTGPEITFSKAAFADPTMAVNQDSLTPLVSITRANTQGLFNPIQEPSFQFGGGSPIGTEWAFQGLNGNPDSGVSAENFGSLIFTDWQNSLESRVGPNILDRPGVVHLVSEDIYFDIVFTEWGQGGGAGGFFTYVRTSAGAEGAGEVVPVPAAFWLMASGLGLLGFLKQRLTPHLREHVQNVG
ncbi:MAG: VPLPA-CTERM sorting domain-containing protein [Chromatiales bacterium]|nr:MAG: VPLPA-CTERM sorting domain-containing protein [Chromatiales bacterium]